MPELSPQITFDPDGILHIAAGLHETLGSPYTTPDFEALLFERRAQTLEEIDLLPGVDVTTADEDYTVDINVVHALGKHFTESGNDSAVAAFLSKLRVLIPFRPADTIDRVLTVEDIDSHTPVPVVHEHFQRWLNAGRTGGGFTEAVAFRTVGALALPFGNDALERARRHFRYSTAPSGQKVVALPVALAVVRRGDFRVHKLVYTETAATSSEGKVRWGSPEFATFGNLASLAVSAEKRSHVWVEATTKRLYPLEARNLKDARQVLSVVLGVGAMAYAAAKYAGEEDILSDAIWAGPQTHEPVRH